MSETREIHTFVTDTATVGVKLGYNRNLGNMEMAKVEAFVSMPCYVDEVDSAAGQVIDKAKALLDAALAEMPDTFAQSGEDPSLTEGETEGQVEETGEAPSEEGGELTIDDIKAYDADSLAALCAANEDWGVSPEDYTEVDDLREVVIGIAFPDDLEAYQAERAAAAEGGGEEGTGEESTGYTREELEADTVTVDDLKSIFEGWGLGAFPKGPPAVAKKAAIAKILKKQEEAMAGA